MLAMTVQARSGNELTPFGVAVEADGRGRIELSHVIGVDPTTLWRWMTGRSRPASQLVRRQAALALGREVNELWPGQGAESDQTDPGLNSDRLSEAA